MSHEQKSSRKTERIRNTHTPDRLEVRNMDLNLTNIYSPKKKLHTSRLSMMPPALSRSSSNLRKLESDNINLELDPLYNECILSQAELILETKNLKDAEISLSNLMIKLSQKTKLLEDKYKLIERRIIDVQALSYLDDSLERIEHTLKDFKIKQEESAITNILVQLKKLLDRFNILRIENVIIPDSAEEIKQFQETLTDIFSLLQEISDPIKCDILQNIVTNYKELILLYQEFSSIKIITEERIHCLQTDVLKSCSHTLSQNDI